MAAANRIGDETETASLHPSGEKTRLQEREEEEKEIGGDDEEEVSEPFVSKCERGTFKNVVDDDDEEDGNMTEDAVDVGD